MIYNELHLQIEGEIFVRYKFIVNENISLSMHLCPNLYKHINCIELRKSWNNFHKGSYTFRSRRFFWTNRYSEIQKCIAVIFAIIFIRICNASFRMVS